MWQKAADVFFYTLYLFPMPTLFPVLYTCHACARCRQGISTCSPWWFNSAFPDGNGWEQCLVPWERKHTPITPWRRLGPCRDQECHPQMLWTSVHPQPFWKMSIRLKSNRQFQKLIWMSWAGAAVLEVRLCKPAPQRSCVSQASGSKSGSIHVTKPPQVKHEGVKVSQQCWRSQERVLKPERPWRTSWRSFSEGRAFRRSEKCPVGYEIALGEVAVVQFPKHGLSVALLKLDSSVRRGHCAETAQPWKIDKTDRRGADE